MAGVRRSDRRVRKDVEVQVLFWAVFLAGVVEQQSRTAKDRVLERACGCNSRLPHDLIENAGVAQ